MIAEMTYLRLPKLMASWYLATLGSAGSATDTKDSVFSNFSFFNLIMKIAFCFPTQICGAFHVVIEEG